MAFTEATKLNVKKKADFTCCWCNDRRNKVDIHHIIPQADDNSSDEENNAAPLCGSCHDLFGNNPDLRKEIISRRDAWYEKCAKTLSPEFGWPIGLDVPLLSFSRELAPTSGIPTKGIQFTDKAPDNPNNPPLLYLSVYFKQSRYFGRHLPPSNEKWLYLEANMRFAFNLRIQVSAINNRDVYELMEFLRNTTEGYALYGPRPLSDQPGDYFYVWRENDENRLMISTFTATNAGISIHARLTAEMTGALANYLEESGYSKLFNA